MSNCAMRHPRICRYYRDYGYCKFSPCSYAHIELVCKKELNEQKSEVDLLKQLVNKNVDEIAALKIMMSDVLKSITNNAAASDSGRSPDSSQDHIEDTVVPHIKMNAERIVDLENSFNIFKTGLNNAFTSQEALTKTAGLHKLQISVIQEEFYTYTQVVDSLEDKLCQLFPHVFASTIPSQQDAMSPSPMPTPPSSNVKKKDFR